MAAPRILFRAEQQSYEVALSFSPELEKKKAEFLQFLNEVAPFIPFSAIFFAKTNHFKPLFANNLAEENMFWEFLESIHLI